MKSRKRHHRSKRGRWDHVNTPAGLRRRKAKIDAAREADAATRPSIEPDPEPLTLWQRFVVLDARNEVMHTVSLYVPTAGRCDQHAGDVDGKRCEEMLTATKVGELLAGMVCKRPSLALKAELRSLANSSSQSLDYDEVLGSIAG